MHLGLFGCLTKLGAKRAKLVQKFVPRSRVGIFRNECTQSTLEDTKLHFGVFHTIWVHLRPFGCLTKLGAKRAELVQNFVPRSRVRIFCNERTRSTPLDPKLMFWYVLYYLDAFGTIWLPYETRCKTGQTNAKVCATKSRRNFSQRTHPIHPIRYRLVAIRNSVLNVPNVCKRSCHEVVSDFFATNAPDPPHWNPN